MSNKNRQFWEGYQKNYKGDLPYGYHWGGESVIHEVSEMCKPFVNGKSILEIGCGGGKWTKALFDRMGAKEVDACDVHDIAVKETKEHEPRANVFKISGKGARLKKIYDVVFSYDVLLHLPPSLVFKYIIDVSKISKQFIFQLPNIKLPVSLNLFSYYSQNEVFENPYTKGYMNFYTSDFVKVMAEYAKGELKEIGNIGNRDTLYKIQYK